MLYPNKHWGQSYIAIGVGCLRCGFEDTLKQQLKKMTTKENKNEMEKYFNDCVTEALKNMRSNFKLDTIHIGGKVNVSGSNRARMIVACHFAYFKLMIRNGCPVFFPIVIDEPKQNGIIGEEYDKLINFMIDEKPDNAQVILAIADDRCLKTVNNKIEKIDLNNSKTLLNDDDYAQAKAEVENLWTDNFKMK